MALRLLLNSPARKFCWGPRQLKFWGGVFGPWGSQSLQTVSPADPRPPSPRPFANPQSQPRAPTP